MVLPDGTGTGAGAPTPESAVEVAQRLEALSALAVGVVRVDLQGRFTYANPAALRILGVTWDEGLGRTPAELGIERYDESGAQVTPERAPIARAVRDGEGAIRTTLRYVRRPAVDVWLESQTVPLRSPGGELVGAVVSFTDVTDRYRIASVERAGIERMHQVLRTMAAGVVLVDADGRIEYANAAAAAPSGLKPEDVIGQLVADPAWRLTDQHGTVLPYDALPVPTALRERREVRGMELGVPTPQGTMAWLRVSAFPLLGDDGTLRGAVVTTEDVSEHHVLAEKLLQAQKLEGIGQLAGAIAHDFNNLLTVIVGNVEVALESAGGDPQLASDLEEIRAAADRGAKLTRQLLTFARKQPVQPRPVHLDRLAATLEKLLHRALGEDVLLERSSDQDLWAVKVDPGQMEQVLLNLAVNARDAMPRGGKLVIETRNRVIAADEARATVGMEPGEFVLLSVRDDGSGMSPDLMARIFEPFFTTKPAGGGSGLGLSICHGVIKQARGFISVESEPGRGTTFRIHLPRTLEPAAEPEAPLDPRPGKGAGTILVVEDEDAVRAYVARSLSGYGYEVLGAATGSLALAAYERMKGPLDLLLTDVVMPGMGGPELASLLRGRQPSLRVLYMTGYFDARIAELGGLSVEENLLLKPFTPMQLLHRVQRELARRPRAKP